MTEILFPLHFLFKDFFPDQNKFSQKTNVIRVVCTEPSCFSVLKCFGKTNVLKQQTSPIINQCANDLVNDPFVYTNFGQFVIPAALSSSTSNCYGPLTIFEDTTTPFLDWSSKKVDEILLNSTEEMWSSCYADLYTLWIATLDIEEDNNK